MKKPTRLKKGDTIAVICPSWGGPWVFPHIFGRGVEVLRQLGFEIREYPTVRMSPDELYRYPQKRAEDINAAFGDRSIAGIISAIGGDDSVRILPYLDRSIIAENPKFIMGYSDFTSVSTFLQTLDLVTFHGPAVMAGFAQLNSFPESYKKYLEQYLFANNPQFSLPTFEVFSHGYPDWSNQENTGKVNELINNDGPRVIQGVGVATGSLFGGSIEVLEMLKGTSYWPETSFWKDKILFLETSEEKPSVRSIKHWLRNYGAMGVFGQISALLFGRARDYSKEDNIELENIVKEVVSNEWCAPELPIVMNLDFGHTDPQLILPLGISVSIDCKTGKITQNEDAFL